MDAHGGGYSGVENVGRDYTGRRTGREWMRGGGRGERVFEHGRKCFAGPMWRGIGVLCDIH